MLYTVSYKKEKTGVVNFQHGMFATDTYVSTSVEPFQTKIVIEIEINLEKRRVGKPNSMKHIFDDITGDLYWVS